MKRLALFAILAAAQVAGQAPERERAALDLDAIRRLPVLSNTRFQPLESYAREVVLSVTGEVEPKRGADGTPVKRGSTANRKRGDPVLTYLEWWLTPEEARTVPWILIDRPGARKLMGLPTDQKEWDHASYDELLANARFLDLAEELKERARTEKESLNLDEVEVLNVYRRLGAFASEAGLLPSQEMLPEAVRGGPPIVPPRGAMERGVRYDWHPLVDLKAPGTLGWADEPSAAVLDAFGGLRDAFRRADATAFSERTGALLASLRALGSPHYPEPAAMDREVRYHRGHFFDHASWLYLLTFILAIFAAIWKNRILHVAAAIPGVAALCLNAYGLAERTALSDRALLGNLYETLLYVGGISFVLALVCEGIFKSRWFLIAGSLLSMAFLRIAQDQALLLNPSISVLQPVLDRNFWIHIHVPVIVASYAPLLLAALMGNLFLLTTVFRPTARDTLREIGRIQYWAMIPGVILLFAGLILGGIWADASWGRFWGWDPKETWGFITWLVFVVVIHGRWSGWLRDYGTAVGTIVGGACLVMTFWGVNFLLPGLHSYANANDGSAGLAWYRRIPFWVISYAAFEVVLVAGGAFLRKRAGLEAPVPASEDPGEAEKGELAPAPARDPVAKR
jgi:ABC-type transport system involved in cytochrome c biogenesis permease subunit